MAKIGLKNVVAAAVKTAVYGEYPTYEKGFMVGAAIEANIANLEPNENKLYADNRVVNIDRTVVDPTMTLGVDEFGDGTDLSQSEVESLLTGSVLETVDGLSVMKAGSVPKMNRVGIGYIRNGRKRDTNEEYCEAMWYWIVQFGGLSSEDAQTKGDNITWSTPTITGAIQEVAGIDADENIRVKVRFAKEIDAIVWLNSMSNINCTETQLGAADASVLYVMCKKYSITSVEVDGTDTPINSAADITKDTKAAVVAAIVAAQEN